MAHTPPIEHAHGILILLRRLKRACANVQTHQNLRFWNTDSHLSHHMIFWNCDESLGEPVLQSIFCLQKWHRNRHLREHEILTLIALWSNYGFGESAYLRRQFRLSLRHSIKMSRMVIGLLLIRAANAWRVCTFAWDTQQCDCESESAQVCTELLESSSLSNALSTKVTCWLKW